MKTDVQLKADVLAELKWEPSVNEKLISVEVSNGLVTLVGHIESYEVKRRAVDAVKRVQGLRALSDELDVNLPNLLKRDDREIARSAKDLLKWMTYFPKGRITVIVKDGWVTLKGELDWDFQRYVVSNSMSHLIGVIGVINKISIKPKELWSGFKTENECVTNTRVSKVTKSTFVNISDSRITLTAPAHAWIEPVLINQAVLSVAKSIKKVHQSAVAS